MFLFYIGANAFSINRRPGKITYGFVLGSTLVIALMALFVAGWAGGKVMALDHLFKRRSETANLVSEGKYGGPLKGVVAGAVLVLLFQVAAIVQLYRYKASLSEEPGAYAGQSAYQADASYGAYDGAGQAGGGAAGGVGGYQSDPAQL